MKEDGSAITLHISGPEPVVLRIFEAIEGTGRNVGWLRGLVLKDLWPSVALLTWKKKPE